MDEFDPELRALETELKQLRPLAPSRALWKGIERELAPARPVTRGWFWLAFPAAAALAFVFGRWHSFSLPAQDAQSSAPAAYPAAAPTFKPVAAENLLVKAQDEGPVTLGDGTPARGVAASYIDTITWEDPQNHASLRWSVPRQDVRVVPVSYQ